MRTSSSRPDFKQPRSWVVPGTAVVLALGLGACGSQNLTNASNIKGVSACEKPPLPPNNQAKYTLNAQGSDRPVTSTQELISEFDANIKTLAQRASLAGGKILFPDGLKTGTERRDFGIASIANNSLTLQFPWDGIPADHEDLLAYTLADPTNLGSIACTGEDSKLYPNASVAMVDELMARTAQIDNSAPSTSK